METKRSYVGAQIGNDASPFLDNDGEIAVLPRSLLPNVKLSWILSFVLFFSLFLPGCGGNPGAPLIRLFEFTGQDVNRRNIFYFKVDWEDGEGDLASDTQNAKIVLRIEDPDNPSQQPIEFPLEFGVGVIKTGTLSGSIPNKEIPNIALSAEIREEDPNKDYPSRLKITAILYDSQGNESNKPWVIIKR